jgi:hypothetical protein
VLDGSGKGTISVPIDDEERGGVRGEADGGRAGLDVRPIALQIPLAVPLPISASAS